MKIEATDQMDPRLVCVSTISRVVGRLLKVHFDGWEDDYDQWMDCENVDIYPVSPPTCCFCHRCNVDSKLFLQVGWAELVGHKLEGPRPPQNAPAKKEKRKPVGRKSKKRTTGGTTPTPPAGNNGANGNGSTASPPAAAAASTASSSNGARKVAKGSADMKTSR